MMNYYLFGNNIDPQNYKKNFPSNLNYSNSSEVYDFIINGLLDSCRAQSHEMLEDFFQSIFSLVDGLRGSQCFNYSFIYHEFYRTMTSLDYHLDRYNMDSNTADFFNNHDFTAVYYNYAYVKYENGDNNSFVHYLSLADSEYKEKNGKNSGDFIKYLLKSKNNLLWNIIPNIISDYNNCRLHPLRELPQKFDLKICDDTIFLLFEDMKYDLLLQLVHSFKAFSSLGTNYNSREYYNEDGDFKVARITRFIGELTWIYEIYLKDKLKSIYPEENFESPLDQTIQVYLRKIDGKLCTRYSQLQQKLVDRYNDKSLRNTEGLKYLTDELCVSNLSKEDQYIYCLLIVKTFRNFYAHYMDRSNIWGRNLYESLKLKIMIYNALIITRKYLDDLDN